MAWESRELQTLTLLGDEREQVKLVAGLLADVKPDPSYEGNYQYVIVQRDGAELTVPGTAAINKVLGPQDIGLFVKLEFLGWKKSSQGRKFRDIDVAVFSGELTDKMRAWPRLQELTQRRSGGTHAPAAAHPAATQPQPQRQPDRNARNTARVLDPRQDDRAQQRDRDEPRRANPPRRVPGDDPFDDRPTQRDTRDAGEEPPPPPDDPLDDLPF